jgi:flagella basal body P-ring formation protein FlgA
MTLNMLVSSKPLQQGQVIHVGDFAIQSGELSQPGIITDEAQIIGKVMKFSIGAGQLLKQDMFRPPYVVTQGQSVQLLSEGQGFKLRTEGIAMNNAAAGQPAQVKVTSGQIISGIAKSDGIVEIQK